MPETVTLGGQTYTVQLPGLSTSRDLLIYFNDAPRRAELAALGLCIGAQLPKRAGEMPLGEAGYRQAKGNLFDFAERTEARLVALSIGYAEAVRAAKDCWTLCADSVLPGLMEAVSRVDFGDAEGGDEQYAVALGMKYGGHPRWFKDLDREDQIDVMAYDLDQHPKALDRARALLTEHLKRG